MNIAMLMNLIEDLESRLQAQEAAISDLRESLTRLSEISWCSWRAARAKLIDEMVTAGEFERLRDRLDSALERASHSRQDLDNRNDRVQSDVYRVESSLSSLESRLSSEERGW